jgi:hypothetical protein
MLLPPFIKECLNFIKICMSRYMHILTKLRHPFMDRGTNEQDFRDAINGWSLLLIVSNIALVLMSWSWWRTSL